MEISPNAGPYPFTVHDLQPDRLAAGTERTLADFYRWRDTNPALIAEHIDYHVALLEETTDGLRVPAQVGRWLSNERNEQFQERNVVREIGFFCVYNLAELPSPEVIDRLRSGVMDNRSDIDKIKRLYSRDGPQAVQFVLAKQFPELARTPELKWLAAQYKRLHRILPETVVQEGGMGKAARTTAGVLVIGVLDTLNDTVQTTEDHLRRILPAAYAYGAAYPIIDDTLQDSHYVNADDHRRYHEAILNGIRTGTPPDASALPDHPLAEELSSVFGMILSVFPYTQYPHLYQAGEAMYLAQDRDANRRPGDVSGGLACMYPDIFMKAAMTRTVANILGRRAISEDYYARSININFINQLRDDLGDYRIDKAASRLTPFTYPRGPQDSNPLYDLFGYSAYIAHQVFGNNPRTTEILTYFSATRLAAYLLADRDHAQTLLQSRGTTAEMARFITRASSLSPRIARQLQREDTKLERTVGETFKGRAQTEIDPRTFISDRRDYINEVIDRVGRDTKPNRLSVIGDYALNAGGKRLRPALTLMLAESIGVPYASTEPLLAAIERFHTASLIIDDLPAQDNALLRRGRPTTHIAYGEAGAQISAVSMFSSGFRILPQLEQYYSTERVTEVVAYFGSALERLCLGQDMDLCFTPDSSVALEDILTMYDLKTSTMLEAALLPLLVLNDVPDVSREAMKTFTHHAGIVFQLRDDILDATATASQLGKDTNNDLSKANVVRRWGIAVAEQELVVHLRAALEACRQLPFNTALLQAAVKHFARRVK